ncbi:MAG: hypothetical protein ACR2P1_27130 [Pseudomonadales bacterium]
MPSILIIDQIQRQKKENSMGSPGFEYFVYFLLLLFAAFGLQQAWFTFTVPGRRSKLARYRDSTQLLPERFLLKTIDDAGTAGIIAPVSHLLFDKRKRIRDASVRLFRNLDPRMSAFIHRCCQEIIHGRVDPIVPGLEHDSNRTDLRLTAWYMLRSTLEMSDVQIVSELESHGAECKDAVFGNLLGRFEAKRSNIAELIQQSVDTLNSVCESPDWLPELLQLFNAHYVTDSKWFVIYNCVWRAGATTASVLLLPGNRHVISEGVCSALYKLGFGVELKDVIAHELKKLRPEMVKFTHIPDHVLEETWAAQRQLKAFNFWIDRATDYGVADDKILEDCFNCSAPTDLSLYVFGGLKYEPLATKLVYSIAHNRTANHEAILIEVLKQQIDGKALGAVLRGLRFEPEARFVLSVIETVSMLGNDALLDRARTLIGNLPDFDKSLHYYRTPKTLKANLQVAIDFMQARGQLIRKLEYKDEPAFVFGCMPNWVKTREDWQDESTVVKDDLSVQPIANVGATAYLFHYHGRTIPVFERGAVHCFPGVRHNSRKKPIIFFNDEHGTRKRAREFSIDQHHVLSR